MSYKKSGGQSRARASAGGLTSTGGSDPGLAKAMSFVCSRYGKEYPGSLKWAPMDLLRLAHRYLLCSVTPSKHKSPRLPNVLLGHVTTRPPLVPTVRRSQASRRRSGPSMARCIRKLLFSCSRQKRTPERRISIHFVRPTETSPRRHEHTFVRFARSRHDDGSHHIRLTSFG